MCGIAGYFGLKSIDKEKINNCVNSMKHRGPDGVGRYFNDSQSYNILLIHTRLAILDLDKRSNQTFRIGRKILIFNGDIYNYIQIKSQLPKLGHKFLTKGDTEVLARTIDQWGEKGLEKLEGMWAFALYDEEKEELILCRDRFGEKPLYIWEMDDGIYFGSEIKSISSLVGRWPKINMNHIYRYLINGYKTLYKVNETFYEPIKEVKRASCLRFFPFKNKKESQYWERKPKFNLDLSYEDAVRKTREYMIEALEIRLRADVPIAFCMSGGVDSNSLISIANKVLKRNINAFTIRNEDKR